MTGDPERRPAAASKTISGMINDFYSCRKASKPNQFRLKYLAALDRRAQCTPSTLQELLVRVNIRNSKDGTNGSRADEDQ